MKSKAILPLFLFFLCANLLNAQDTMKHYVLEIGDFNSLQVIDPLNVTYKCNTDSAGFAAFDAPDNTVSSVFFTNKGGKLKIEKNEDGTIELKEFPHVTVYSNFLSYAENCGDSTLTVISPAPGATFKARIIGNGTLNVSGIYATQTEGTLDTGKGTLTLSGTTKALKLKNIGTGKIEAENLSSQTAVVTVLGTGSVACNVSEELTLKGMGSGKVTVKGKPQIKKRTIGSFNIVTEAD